MKTLNIWKRGLILFGYKFLLLAGIFLLSLTLKAEEEKLQVKMYENPKREVSVIVSDEGFYPNKLSFFEGEQVRFIVTSTKDMPGCFIVSGHELYLAANKGKITEGEILFGSPGEYNFYCPSMKEKGKITILRKKKIGRGIASQIKKKPTYWMPKED